MSTLIQITKPTELIVNNTPIIGGVDGRVLFQGTGNVLQQSANLFWDETNGRLGIGTSSPSNSLTIKTGVNDDGILLESSIGNPLFLVRKDGTSNSTAELFQYANGSIRLAIRSASNFSYFNGGNFGFGTTTDAGFRLDVNGTARVQGLGTFGNAIRVIGQGIFGANGINNAGVVGIDQNGTSSAARIYMCNGGGSSYPIWFDAGGNSYFNAGNVGIGTTSPSFTLDVNGTARVSSILYFTNGNTQIFQNSNDLYFAVGSGINRLVIKSTGNILIGTTTDAGFKLDVNGTARVSGLLTVDNLTGNSVRASFFNTINNAITVFQSFTASGNAAFYNSVSIGTTSTPVASAQLEVVSTTKGFLPPRMTTTQKNAIASPAAGLVVYDTTLAKLCVYTTTWETITSL